MFQVACIPLLNAIGDAGGSSVVRAGIRSTLGPFTEAAVAAAADVLAHGAIASMSWLGVLWAGGRGGGRTWAVLRQAGLAALVGMAVDLDRFVETRTLRLDASSLLGRQGFMHCGASAALATSLAWLLAFAAPGVVRAILGPTPGLLPPAALSSLVAAAVVSHQLRDAARRGWWLLPPSAGPRTAPIPWPVSVLLQAATGPAVGLAAASAAAALGMVVVCSVAVGAAGLRAGIGLRGAAPPLAHERNEWRAAPASAVAPTAASGPGPADV